jgi:hypothetical protein
VRRAQKFDVVLVMIADMGNAQIAMPLHRFCISVVLFTSVFRSSPPEQTLPAAAILDKQQLFWIDRVLPSLPPLTTTWLHQAVLPIKDGGLAHTVPSDVVMPAYCYILLVVYDVT